MQAFELGTTQAIKHDGRCMANALSVPRPSQSLTVKLNLTAFFHAKFSLRQGQVASYTRHGPPVEFHNPPKTKRALFP